MYQKTMGIYFCAALMLAGEVPAKMTPEQIQRFRAMRAEQMLIRERAERELESLGNEIKAAVSEVCAAAKLDVAKCDINFKTGEVTEAKPEPKK